MTDRDESAAASEPGPRHAAPRVGVRRRIRGRVMAIAAVPTAMLVGAAYTPTTLAVADTQSDKACASAPDTVLEETPVPKSEIKVLPAPSSTVKAATKKSGATASPSTAKVPVPTATATAAQPAPSADTAPRNVIGDILTGIDGIFHPQAGTASTPAAAPTTAAKAAAAPAASTAPAAPAAPKASATTAPAAKPAAQSASPSASPSPSATGPNCLVDTSKEKALAAPTGHVVPDQNWVLHSSKLALHGSVFNGVYDVKTPTGSKRVLKFTTASVDIGDLDMSTIEVKDKTFHVKAAPGTTSTMRNGPITMYVESLSGHLSAIYGLPIPIDLGEITLTPDTLPKWLWDLIGSVPIPLDITLDKAKAVQAGQFGGTLKIPGMHLFNDDQPYDG
ncbi:hypothetical protein [Streptomyces sp. NRRL B-24484]|uniref:hypothetical protein n=1 Tax=Streptomyces sp. NRRL B-24484 TaxID=1463833 RepID=UPI0004C277EB|nr:hypothetical protein [Streptomyces sp. NRRL B-24484]